jgi:hypothetical protein
MLKSGWIKEEENKWEWRFSTQSSSFKGGLRLSSLGER